MSPREQDITNNDSYLSIFAQDIMELYLIGVMRKVNNLPPYWQERLLEHDYRLSILKTIKEDNWRWFWLNSIENYGAEGSPILINNPLLKPYIRLSAIDDYRTMAQALEGCIFPSLTALFKLMNYIAITKTL